MPDILIPPGYKTVFLGSVPGSLTGDFIPLEESAPEECRMLVRLDFSQYPDIEACSQLNQELLSQGVPPWPEHQDIVFLHPTEPAIYLAWWKGMVWWALILVLIGSMVLPPLIGSVIWAILPDEVKQMIEMLLVLGLMVIMMSFVSKMTKSASPAEKSKPVEARPRATAEGSISRLAGEVETASRALGEKK
ncbi:hypothetical protein DA01_07520 [Dehalococcoides mccartyi]|uniref:Uncharacterized protein n=1 Tax=Dehalococcoides mccartyi TaxID=61435 RepID=A0A0V8M0F5_9CHLR|nr:hypothetical protein [Dehalococcoides mccartyi]KSV17242.1 hypothetical protein DA01_07520 [Dehalococcoides mccartyi]